MRDNLLEMFELQEKLDTRISSKHAEREQEKQIALLVELGELFNELPSNFKYWKRTAKDDRAKALVELVDCWHFALSLDNPYRKKAIECTVNCFQNFQMFHANNNLYNLIQNVCTFHCGRKVERMLILTYRLGFSFDEVYDAYKLKNEVNHNRVVEGY